MTKSQGPFTARLGFGIWSLVLPSIPTWIRTRAQTFGGSDASATPSGQQIGGMREGKNACIAVIPHPSSLILPKSRRWASHPHGPHYECGAFLTRATPAPIDSRGARSRTLCGCFGGSLLSQEHTPENHVSGGTRTRHPEVHSLVCMPLHHRHRQPAEGVGVEPTRPCGSLAFQARPVAHRVARPLSVSSNQ
jgi:hypothetical protein